MTSERPTYLDRIVEQHRREAARDQRRPGDLREACSTLPTPRGFRRRLVDDSRERLAVIAEVKRRSPSKGDLNVALDPAELATRYGAGGASCLSVLTDVEFFGGSADDLRAARSAVDLPVIRKDFTVCANDVLDARLMGADCVLLIASVLSAGELDELHSLAAAVGLDVLVEVHDEPELQTALDVGATLVGVNQRDLYTFEVDHERAVRLARHIPDGIIKVAESGVRGVDDATALAAAGYHAVLVGESLVTSGDPVAAVAALRDVQRHL